MTSNQTTHLYNLSSPQHSVVAHPRAFEHATEQSSSRMRSKLQTLSHHCGSYSSSCWHSHGGSNSRNGALGAARQLASSRGC
mmetsp:Transcript_3639/g.9819  ORF Transcript_3639/g.9819 Transcript_3639/m.9819 type:complete len:82 (-) Transcript_3639:2218-2463(-)